MSSYVLSVSILSRSTIRTAVVGVKIQCPEHLGQFHLECVPARGLNKRNTGLAHLFLKILVAIGFPHYVREYPKS